MFVLEKVPNFSVNNFPQTLSLGSCDNAQISYLRFAALHDDLIPVIVDRVAEAYITPSKTVCGSLIFPRKLYCTPVAPLGS